MEEIVSFLKRAERHCFLGLAFALAMTACGGSGGRSDGGGDAGAPDAARDADALNADATLVNLELSVGVLAPGFDPEGTSYTATVAVSTEAVVLTPTAAVPGGVTIAVSGTAVASGTGSAPMALALGDTIIDVVVTAEAGKSQTYSVTFTRGGAISQEAYLKASNTGNSDFFGGIIALDGDTLAVGALSEDSCAPGIDGDQASNGCEGAGAVYVFVREGETWTQQAYLKASNAEEFDIFGLVLALDGDTLAVGAQSESSCATGIDGDQSDNDCTDAGAVYVFVRSGETWTQQAYVKASNTEFADGFGSALALDGETMAVGSIAEDSCATGVGGDQSNNGCSAAGAVYVFARTGETWAQEAYIKASNTGTGDNFGGSDFSLSILDDTLAVGAFHEFSCATGVDGNQASNGCTFAGAAYVFVRTGVTWTQQAYLKASNSEANDFFGGRVSLSSDAIAVSAFGESSCATGADGDQTDNACAKAGAVYVFTRTGDVWGQQAYLKASNSSALDRFGSSVSLSGAVLGVSAREESSCALGIDGDQDNDDCVSAGATYVFARVDEAWVQRAYLKASNSESSDRFGSCVSVSESSVAIGALGEDSCAIGIDGDQADNGCSPNAGAVYIFRQ